MADLMRIATCILISSLCWRAVTVAAPPTSADDRLVVELVAQEPEVVTPTGIAVDPRGRIWVIENNTHFRPKDYAGPAGDRILVMDQFGADGRAGRIAVFADGLKDSMSLAVRGADLFLVTRNAILVLRDTDGDGKAVQRRAIVTLDTEADYPHNGLNGIIFSPIGDELYFCLGLNMGKAYKVIGSDGATLTGGGEGGSMYRCRPDGTGLKRVATGFWNVHDLTFDAFGRLLAVDNDPDDRPPCRLLDIIEGGDYGWQYRNGRRGIHPFTSWFGERLGTLPMISAVGEAPSGIIAYEAGGLPAEFRGQAIVTSWGDHVVQHFALRRAGASFTSEPQVLVQGGQDFRPVGIAIAPDGSLVMSDWVDRSYAVHGKGRVWRVRMKAGAAAARAGEVDMGARSRIAAMWKAAPFTDTPRAENLGLPIEDSDEAVRCEAIRLLGNFAEPQKVAAALTPAIRAPRLSPAVYRAIISALPVDAFPVSGDPHWTEFREDRFVFAAALASIARSGDIAARIAALPAHDETEAVLEVLAWRRSGREEGIARLPAFLADPRPGVRRAALQWVGEDRLRQFGELIPRTLKSGAVTRDVLLAAIAAREKLATEPPAPGKPPAEHPPGQLAVEFVFDASLDVDARRLALELSDPRDPRLDAAKLRPLLDQFGGPVVAALAWREDEAAQAALRDIAADESRPLPWRLDAATGLARSATVAATRTLLLDLLHHGPSDLRREALRSLRGSLDRDEVARILADFDRAMSKGLHAGEADVREFAEQILLAARPTPDALGDDDRRRLEKLSGPRPADEAAWQSLLAEKGDANAGRRTFFHAKSAQCFICHAIDNRGGAAGPNLTAIGGSTPRRKIIESILFPSREIAPMYVPIVLTLRDGRSVTGVGLDEVGARGIRLTDATGKLVQVDVADVISRRLEKVSLMPDNLADALTRREFRDLVEFLAERK
jgi:putative membrane-bound dehydrogenase-like protein